MHLYSQVHKDLKYETLLLNCTTCSFVLYDLTVETIFEMSRVQCHTHTLTFSI